LAVIAFLFMAYEMKPQYHKWYTKGAENGISYKV